MLEQGSHSEVIRMETIKNEVPHGLPGVGSEAHTGVMGWPILGWKDSGAVGCGAVGRLWTVDCGLCDMA
jgi:hypothetical protein